MDSISVIKPDMAVLGLNTLGLSPFGVLSQLFTMELSSRAGLDVTPMLPLDLALLSEDGGDEEQTQQSRRLDLSLELIIRRLNETLVRSENAAGAKTGSESGAAAKEMSAKTKQELEHIILRELRIREGRRLTETRRDIRTVELVAPTQSTAQPSVQSLPQTYSALAIQRRGTSLRGYGQNKTEKDAASVFGTDSRPAGNAADVRAAYAAEHGAMALKADGIRAGRLKDPTQSSVPATGGWDVTWREEHPGFAGKPPLRETEVKPERSILLPDVLRERRAEALRRHEASTEERGAELEYIQNAAETAADKDIGGYNRASGTAGSVPVIAEAGPGAQAVPETERRSAGMLPETVPARAAASPGKAEKSTPRAASYAETADTVNPAEQSGGYERREYERRKDERALLFTDGGAVPERKAPADDGTGEGAAPRAVPVSADETAAETAYLE
ncbi:MAG: hypothetical protein J5449_01750, partial [Oscillospiraceae bacterium]|nr:hypothetical protein [Oscillospiraceae bacterium]